MARYDKYDPISGGFRAALDVDITGDAAGEFGPKAVSLNASGRLVVGTAGISRIAGILVKNAPKRPIAAMSTSMQGTPYPTAWMGQKAGDIVDVMTSGEIVDIAGLGFTPGQAIYAATDGSLTATVGTNIKIGFIAGSGAKLRLVVRLGL